MRVWREDFSEVLGRAGPVRVRVRVRVRSHGHGIDWKFLWEASFCFCLQGTAEQNTAPPSHCSELLAFPGPPALRDG